MVPYVMCKKFTCLKANECFRLRAIPDEPQLYNDFIGLCNSDDGFQMIMKIRPDDKVIELNSLEEFIEEGEDNLIAK